MPTTAPTVTNQGKARSVKCLTSSTAATARDAGGGGEVGEAAFGEETEREDGEERAVGVGADLEAELEQPFDALGRDGDADQGEAEADGGQARDEDVVGLFLVLHQVWTVDVDDEGPGQRVEGGLETGEHDGEDARGDETGEGRTGARAG